MISRGQNFKELPLKIVGSSSFGRYPKISVERTYNMFASQNFLVPYSGYQSIEPALGEEGRAIYSSSLLNRLVTVFDNKVFLVDIIFFQETNTYSLSYAEIGTLATTTGDVYIAENNKGQIAISDNTNIYVYDATLTPSFQIAPINFAPGYITFHDTYFLCAASQDQTYTPAANNTWRLSESNNGLSWPTDAQHVGLLQTKPDTTKGVTRFPSRGNMIFVFGQHVTEAWFDVGYQLFPYQRNTSFNIDYGCLNPQTIAANDELVVWLAKNEKSGPIILASDGGMPEKITTDGIDYLFSQLRAPQDSEAFIFRQDGHLFYHINFYTDNFSLFYDFTTKQFYNATDENGDYYIAKEVAFFNNQYYFVSRNSGKIYIFDTIYTTYDGAEIPRIRICQNVRLPSQEYFIVNDVGFTVESGETNYSYSAGNPDTNFAVVPHVALSISVDGGASFSSEWRYDLPSIGNRQNRLMWWQLGLANDFVAKFSFSGFGRVVCTDGQISIRQ